MNLQVDLH